MHAKKGAVKPVVPWPDRLFVVDPTPIIGVVEQLARKGGRVAVARCPSKADAIEAGDWLVDRLSRLARACRSRRESTPVAADPSLVLTT